MMDHDEIFLTASAMADAARGRTLPLFRSAGLAPDNKLAGGFDPVEFDPGCVKAVRDAAERLIELNNKYAIDGRNPNSYSGIFWVLGRNDRAWGPERAVFGTIRYMGRANTRRKLHVARYIERWDGWGS